MFMNPPDIWNIRNDFFPLISVSRQNSVHSVDRVAGAYKVMFVYQEIINKDPPTYLKNL